MRENVTKVSRDSGYVNDKKGGLVVVLIDTEAIKMHIVGTCMEMCPRSERQMREREGMLHKYERQPLSSSGMRGVSGRNYGGRRQLPQADIDKTVKSFARSAAGLDKTVPEDLRPPEVLLRTVKYLCQKVLTLQGEPFNVIYDFVFDRLRSVRQDLVIQRITDASAIAVLEIIIRFHVFAAYKLGGEPVEKFDPHINYKHLVDCLKKLMYFYELNDYWESSRNEFETLYLIVTLETKTSDSLMRAVALRSRLNDKIFDTSLDVCFSFDCYNFTRIFRSLHAFPLLTRSYFTQYTAFMRCSAFERMTAAYGASTSKVPVQLIQRILLYRSVDATVQDLYRIGAEVIKDEKSDEKFAKFSKAKAGLCRAKIKELSDQLADLGLEKLDDTLVAYKLVCPMP